MSRRIGAAELREAGFVNAVFETAPGEDERFRGLVLREVEERLGPHLSGDSLLGIKRLIRQPETDILDTMNAREVFGGLERFVAGVPQVSRRPYPGDSPNDLEGGGAQEADDRARLQGGVQKARIRREETQAIATSVLYPVTYCRLSISGIIANSYIYIYMALRGSEVIIISPADQTRGCFSSNTPAAPCSDVAAPVAHPHRSASR